MVQNRAVQPVKAEIEELSISSDLTHDIKPEPFTTPEPDSKPAVKSDLAGWPDCSLSISDLTPKGEDTLPVDVKIDAKRKLESGEHAIDPPEGDDRKARNEDKVKVKVKEVKKDESSDTEDLNYEQTFDRNPPEGYIFVIAGSPYVTRHCKEITLAEGLKVWEVLVWQRKTVRGVAIGPQRIGLHIPIRIYDHVQMMSAERDQKTAASTARSRIVLESRARMMISEIYPRIPADRLESVQKFVYQGFVAKSTGGFHKIPPGAMWNMVDIRVKHFNRLVHAEGIPPHEQTIPSHVSEWQPLDGPVYNPHPPLESSSIVLPRLDLPPRAPSAANTTRTSARPNADSSRRKKKKKQKKTQPKKKKPSKKKKPVTGPLSQLRREFAATLPSSEMKRAAAEAVEKRKLLLSKETKREMPTKSEEKPDVQLKSDPDTKPKAERDLKTEIKPKTKEETVNTSLTTPASESPRKKPRLGVVKTDDRKPNRSGTSVKREPNEMTADIKPILPFSPNGGETGRRKSTRLSERQSTVQIKGEPGLV